MGYKNQLVLTGNINDVGAPIRTNISDSYRFGLELWASKALGKGFLLKGNVTFSQNKIMDFTEYIDNWDTWEQEVIDHGTTDLAFSPSVIAFAQVDYNLVKGLNVLFSGKYVGEQFIDNTSNKNTVLEDYLIGNFQVRYEFNPSFAETISFNLLVNNIFDKKYSANAWTYRYISNGYDGRNDDPYTQLEGNGVYNLTGYYPQAGRHFLLGMTVRF
jgi:iron complex outermembrane receptor protein